MSTIDVVDLKTLRKKYLKRTIHPDRLSEDIAVFLNKHTKELELEFSQLVKWSGDEYNYTDTMTLDDDSVILKISPLKCGRLCFDDASGSGYKGKRVDEYDYYRLDCVLTKAIDDE
jgi:hypothetical protein